MYSRVINEHVSGLATQQEPEFCIRSPFVSIGFQLKKKKKDKKEKNSNLNSLFESIVLCFFVAGVKFFVEEGKIRARSNCKLKFLVFVINRVEKTLVGKKEGTNEGIVVIFL